MILPLLIPSCKIWPVISEFNIVENDQEIRHFLDFFLGRKSS